MTAVSVKADVPDDAGWGPRAACRSADPELFFPVSGAGPSVAQIAEAKTVCARCEVRGECLAIALATRQLQGSGRDQPGGAPCCERRPGQPV